jgi:L,D-transpeptidase YcbB
MNERDGTQRPARGQRRDRSGHEPASPKEESISRTSSAGRLRSPRPPAPRALLALLAVALATALLLGWSGDWEVARRAAFDVEPAAATADLPRAERASAEPTLLRLFLERHARPSPALAALRDRTLRSELVQALDEFYRARGDRVAWIAGRELAPSGRRLLDELSAARVHGLDPRDYDPRALESRAAVLASRRGPSLREQLQLELDLAAAFALYLSDLARGRVDPTRLELDWHAERRTVDLPAMLEAAASGPDGGVERAAPASGEYRRLLEALARYRDLDARGGWRRLAAGEYPEPGGDAPAPLLRSLATRLQAEGDLEPEAAADLDERWTGAAGPVPYASELEQAVRRFQQRVGLEVDGRVGEDTVAALRVPVEERVAQVELALERWRWLPDPAARRILVEVPAFELTAFDGGEPVLTMPVVVGEPGWDTPTFREDMTYVVLNPAWNVPEGIATGEVVPAALADPAYLRNESLALIDNETGDEVDPATVDLDRLDLERYRFRQAEGPANPLGRIKFMLPNRFDVYLHDTPARSAFERADRALSHGCIRLAEPLRLADWVLKGLPEQDPRRLRARIASGVRATLELERPIPVDILYVTARAGDDGVVRFHADVYGHDQTLRRALAARSHRAGSPSVAAAHGWGSPGS